MKIVFVSMGIILTLTVLAGLFLYLAGLAQPERHAGSITFTMAKPSTVVWAALTDYAAMPQWWPAVKKIRFETRPYGEVVTWDTDRRGRETGFRTTEEKAPAQLVREITGDNLPFGGTWTYALVDANSGTQLTLTEDGFVKPPLFRGIAKFFLKPDATMRVFA